MPLQTNLSPESHALIPLLRDFLAFLRNALGCFGVHTNICLLRILHNDFLWQFLPA